MPESWFINDVPDYVTASLKKFVNDNVDCALKECLKDALLYFNDSPDNDDIIILLSIDDDIEPIEFSLNEVLTEEANNDYGTDRLKKIANLLNKHLDRINEIINRRET